MTTRRLRPTLLLQTLAALASLAVFTGVVLLFGRGTSLGVMVGAFIFWVLALELEVLPWLLERFAVRWAEKHGGLLGSRWFTFVPQDHRRAQDLHRQHTRDNPTLW